MTKEILWAKKKEENGRLLWLPLSQHLEDTRNMIGLLWEHWLSDGQKKMIADSLELKKTDDLMLYEQIELGKRLAQFLGAVHDIGKATPAFQTKKSFSNSKDLDIQLLEKLVQGGFNDIGAIELVSPTKSPHSNAGQYLLSLYGVQEDIASIIGGHHGKPIDNIEDVKNQGSYLANYFQVENNDGGIYRKWEQVQKDIFSWALNSSGFESVSDLPQIKQPAQVILTGLLIMADWIASNDYYFPLLTLEETEVANKDKRIQEGFEEWKKSNLWTPEAVVEVDTFYQKRFGFVSQNVQSVLAKILAESTDPGIVILEAPMGSGKTEASLVAAEQLANKTGRSGLFFGLPTQASSNSIFKRIEKWVKNLPKDQSDNFSIQLVHGKAALNEDFLELFKESGTNIDDEENRNVIVNEWFYGRKKAALDDFVVGTVDQFLMVSLKQKYLALRHLGFSKKVVVIDEVHAYDAYMSQYLLEAIRWMGAYGVPIIILSATLPLKTREKIMMHYLMGKKKLKKVERNKISQQLQTDAYPLITYTDGLDVYQEKSFKQSDQKKIKMIRISEEELPQTVSTAMEGGGVIGIIVNTVRRAQKLAKMFSEMFGEDMVDLLHSSFIATERIRKEKELLCQIGKGGERPQKKIIIGTQVIEQSLDIDFDVIISDLAPMDLLIQRIGRLHRHSIKRPQAHEQAKFYILGTSEDLIFDEGSSFVYGDYLLIRTQCFLPDEMILPDDISPLVQKVYGSESISDCLSLTFNQKYLDAKNKHDNEIASKKAKARAYRINDPILIASKHRKNSLIGWLKNVHPNDSNVHPNDSEERAYAQVRDIEDMIEVIALKKVSGGYGLFTENQDISQKIDESKIAKKVAQNTLRLPMSLSKIYNIDQTIKELECYTYKYLNPWQNSSWLKGALGIIFDKNNEFLLNGFKISYSEKYGVTIERLNKE